MWLDVLWMMESAVIGILKFEIMVVNFCYKKFQEVDETWTLIKLWILRKFLIATTYYHLQHIHNTCIKLPTALVLPQWRINLRIQQWNILFKGHVHNSQLISYYFSNLSDLFTKKNWNTIFAFKHCTRFEYISKYFIVSMTPL